MVSMQGWAGAPRGFGLAKAGRRGWLLLAGGAVAVSLVGAGAPALSDAVVASQEPAGVGSPDGTASSWGHAGWGDDTSKEDEKASKLTGDWHADHDLGSLYTVAKRTGAQTVWKSQDGLVKDRRVTGRGVTVALIDTGIAPVTGLNTAGKVVNGPDLSFDSQDADTRHTDGFGHGTHMAGIIAGRDPVKDTDVAKREHVAGVAPGATVLNVKVGASDGSADVSQVIAGIDWVVQHRDELDVRVLNLSYGTPSVQSYVDDPLAHAVENAWRAGIVVVVSAGNDGERGQVPVTMPAADPFVLAVGAVDHRGTGKVDDDAVAAFSNPGTGERHPDLLAPGKSVVSLRAPGSAADRDHPEGLVTGDDSGRLFRGSGTSQAAAVVSGAAALLLQVDPSLTPDQVKGLLLAGTATLRTSTTTAAAGVLDIEESLKLLRKAHHEDGVPSYNQDGKYAPSTGLGSLEASRGGRHVVDPETGQALTGEQDIFGQPFDRRSWSQDSMQRRSWSGGTWNGARWTGDTWSADAWDRRSWSGSDWARRSWSGGDWARRSWSTTDFNRRSWSTAGWSSPPA